MKSEGSEEPIVLFLAPFCLLVLVALLIIVYRGRHSALITLSHERVVIEESTLSGTRRHE